jgi:galactokinase
LFRILAPGRICLFGEHQDYLGLPVIAAAIDLYLSAEVTPKPAPGFVIDLPDTGEQMEIAPAQEQTYAHSRDYLHAAVNVLRREGLTWPQGYHLTVHGDIPINAGVSSSSALVVMWLRVLLETGQPPRDYSPEDLARWGYVTEVKEFGEPGGMMDHYCSAVGGVLRIDTRPPFAAERWNLPLSGFVLGNSLQPKATVETLGRNRRDVTEGMQLIKEHLPTFDLASTPLSEAEPYLQAMPPLPARRLRANLINRDLTSEGATAILAGDSEQLGRLLSAHHAQLRDGLDLSTDKIERMMEAALAAGALGGKVNGSGGGGCMFAYAPGHEEAVSEAIRREGGVPYIVTVDRGARRTQ